MTTSGISIIAIAAVVIIAFLVVTIDHRAESAAVLSMRQAQLAAELDMARAQQQAELDLARAKQQADLLLTVANNLTSSLERTTIATTAAVVESLTTQLRGDLTLSHGTHDTEQTRLTENVDHAYDYDNFGVDPTDRFVEPTREGVAVGSFDDLPDYLKGTE